MQSKFDPVISSKNRKTNSSRRKLAAHAERADLARASPEAVAERSATPGSSSLLLSILQPLLDLCFAIDNLQLKVAACDALSTWLTKALKCVELSPSLLLEVSHALDVSKLSTLYHLMLKDWDLGVSLHGPLRNIFSGTLLLHKKIRATYATDIENIVSDVLHLEPSRKAMYYALELIKKTSSIALILRCDTHFFVNRLLNMQDTSIATPLGRLLSSALLESLPRRPTSDEQLNWLRVWQEPIEQALLSGNQLLASNVITYLLGDLLRAAGEASFIFIEGLARKLEFPKSTGKSYVLLECLSLAKDVGLVEEINSELFQRLTLDSDVLQDLLEHSESSLRVAALKLLLLHPKTTTPIRPKTYDLVKATLAVQFCENDMQFRKDIMNCIRSFLIRFQGSLNQSRSLLRKYQKSGKYERTAELQAYLQTSQDFAMWLIVFLKDNLKPGTGYQTTYMTLQTLQLMTGLGWSSDAPAICDKFAAFRITTSSNNESDIPLPLAVTMFDAEMIRLLLDCLGDSFEDNRTLATSILSTVRHPILGLETPEQIRDLYMNVCELLQSPRGRDGDGGARLMQFLYTKFIQPGASLALAIDPALQGAGIVPRIRFLEILCDSIHNDLQYAARDILSAASNHPIHGRLSAISYMLSTPGLYQDSSAAELTSHWTHLHKHILDLCKETWNCVREVLCDDSPEGSLPTSIQHAQGDPLRSSDAQVILSYCWMALREVSNLLRTVLLLVPQIKDQRLLDADDYSQSGDLFLAWLTEVRHRGAFSAVYPNFIDICKRLLKMESDVICRSLPALWLQISLSHLRDSVHKKDITRRSGGLPMSIISIMVAESETDSAARSLIGQTFTGLMALATTTVIIGKDENIEYPQVHGMNTLKDIFLESRLTSCSMDYIESCLIIAIDGFSSPAWAIRNCSLMLFSALLRRAFGSKLSRMDSTGRTFSARLFFSRYPRVLVRLCEELQAAVTALFDDERPTAITGLHPCLTLLSRLAFADVDDAEDYDNYEKVLGLLTVISTSKIWQIRSMAAQAVPTFVEPELVASFIVQQLNQATTADQNALHGRLLMIYHVLRYNLDLRQEDLTYVESILDDVRRLITAKLASFTSKNSCAVTETIWLRILLFLGRTTRIDLNLPLRQRVVDYCARQLADWSKTYNYTGSSALLEVMTAIILRTLANPKVKWLQPLSAATVVKNLLTDPRTTVRLQMYQMLPNLFQKSPILTSNEIHATLEIQCSAEMWPVARTAARRCLASLPPRLKADDPLSSGQRLQVYISDLQQAHDDNSDNAFTLTLIGRLIGESQIQEPKFLDTIRRFTRDGLPYETRKAVLISLISSRILLPLGVCSNGSTSDRSLVDTDGAMNYLPVVFSLLTDDDERIRLDTAQYIGNDILTCSPKMPERMRAALLRHLVRTFSDSEPLQEVLIQQLGLESDLSLALTRSLNPSATLFAIEKQNLWHNAVDNTRSTLSALSQMPLTKVNISKLVGIANTAVKELLQQFQLQQIDGPLGWTSTSDVWQMIVQILELCNFLVASHRTDAATKEVISTQLRELRDLSSDINLHPMLIRLMATVTSA